ncbi:MAG TPA: PEP-CTERM sorting domain-containing protein [Caulobacteraceae bacterium]|nr:PEP-CTERM sorting domain-containing protein [Caulobacteraceae bacterium]
MTLKHLLAGAAVAASLVSFAAARAAAPIILGTEDPTNGFTGNLFASSFPNAQYLVASDGETAFEPFGATFDVSDGLNFGSVGFTWNQAADSTWTSLGNQTWVLPAANIPGCGSENEPTCEPVGHFISPSAWNPTLLGTYEILEAGGGVSDIIILSNTAAGADVRFFSDPITGVPEPATWALTLVGIGGLGLAMRVARSNKVAVAA